MKKSEAISTVQRMFQEIQMESEFYGGFNEMDQTQIEFTLSNEFLKEVSLKGLQMLMEKVEECSNTGISRRKEMNREEIIEALEKRSSCRG